MEVDSRVVETGIVILDAETWRAHLGQDDSSGFECERIRGLSSGK
jgi:hypothetical protein